jgi:hypothetical protein
MTFAPAAHDGLAITLAASITTNIPAKMATKRRT